MSVETGVYNKTQLLTKMAQVSPTLTINNVTTLGQTDLYVLRDTLNFSAFEMIYLPLIVK